MNITVRLFAMLKEQAGTDRIALELPAGATVAQAVEAAGRQVGIESLLERMPLAHAVNREYADSDAALHDADELALIPPVSGGAPEDGVARVHAAIVTDAPSADRLTALVADTRAGAVVVFHGVTRDVDRLEYEAFDEMAGPLLERILGEVAAEHQLIAIAAEHRTGSVPLSEASVIVAVSAGHRPEAFAGARAAIDRIKAELPVWKQEVDGGEGTWVEGTPIGEVAR